MTIEDQDTIDLVGIDRERRCVRLVVSDHLDWDDIDSHLSLLQAKIYRYADFVDSGELYEMRPEARELHVVIDVVLLHSPPAALAAFVAGINTALEPERLTVSYRVESLAS